MEVRIWACFYENTDLFLRSFQNGNIVTLFKNYLNFTATSPAYGTFYRITGGNLLQFCCDYRLNLQN